MNLRLCLWTAIALPAGLFMAAPVAAQVEEGLIVQPVIPQDFNRDRNVSVTQTSRPDYAPVGILLGGFTFFPRVEAGAGGTSNTYLTSSNKIGSAFGYLQGAGRLVSNWSTNALQLSGLTTQRYYVDQSRRDEHLWAVDAYGRLDVYHSIAVEANVNASQSFDNLFSGEVTPTVAALSRFRRVFESSRATYTQGRFRTFLVADHASFNFSDVPLVAGGSQDQRFRNRQITRLTLQAEYARTPSLALFAQVSGGITDYGRALLPNGNPNLDSKAIRLLGGVNVDISGLVRGTIGLGYSIRNYDAGIYRTVQGLSVETKLEAFPTVRLTVGVNAQRTIEDSTVGNFSPFWNTKVGTSVDYELLRNLILSAAGDVTRQRYLQSSLRTNIYTASASARFLLSRRVTLRGYLSYSDRNSHGQVAGLIGAVNEARAEIALGYQL